MEDRILVVIPYLAGPAQGRELEMSVAGWRKHFKENFLIVVVGDYNPVVESGDDIIFIKCHRVKWPGKGNYWAHIDHVNKFRTVREKYPESTGFIYTCDDIYAIRDFTLADVKKLKVRRMEICGSFHDNNAWVVDDYRTKKILIRQGLPVMNWVCHLPVYYEWDKLFSIYSKYQCDTKSRVVEQLYFNTYHANDDFVVIDEGDPNDWQLKLFDKDYNAETIQNAIGTKYWISNSVRGWKDEIEKVLLKYYGLEE